MFVQQVGALTGGSSVSMTAKEGNYQPRYIAPSAADSVSIARQTSKSRGLLRTVRNLAAGAVFALGLHSCGDATQDLNVKPTPTQTKTLSPTAQTVNSAAPAVFAADTTGVAKNLQLVDTLFASNESGGYTAIKLQDAYTTDSNVRYRMYDLNAKKIVQGVTDVDFFVDDFTKKLTAKYGSGANTTLVPYTKSGNTIINDLDKLSFTPESAGVSVVKDVTNNSSVVGKIKMIFQKTKQVAACVK
jgi:hypothetical protein